MPYSIKKTLSTICYLKLILTVMKKTTYIILNVLTCIVNSVHDNQVYCKFVCHFNFIKKHCQNKTILYRYDERFIILYFPSQYNSIQTL
ncbi:unnamed protein product [Parnassius mnemosyne]|uniref:Uncharacterized protein n=1 Tax=Parnassius mnemosyne TaxID=213953 RepID=A0AAV1LHT2_9NEOP